MKDKHYSGISPQDESNSEIIIGFIGMVILACMFFAVLAFFEYNANRQRELAREKALAAYCRLENHNETLCAGKGRP